MSNSKAQKEAIDYVKAILIDSCPYNKEKILQLIMCELAKRNPTILVRILDENLGGSNETA